MEEGPAVDLGKRTVDMLDDGAACVPRSIGRQTATLRGRLLDRTASPASIPASSSGA
jgi:hypothetical protein